MFEKLKSPLVLIALGGSLLLLVGTFMGWFSFSNIGLLSSGFIASLVEQELKDKKTVAIVGAVLTGAGAVLNLKMPARWVNAVALVIGLYVFVMLFNQRPTALESAATGIRLTPGYWFSLVGALGVSVGHLGLLVKSVGNSSKGKAPTPPASPTA